MEEWMIYKFPTDHVIHCLQSTGNFTQTFCAYFKLLLVIFIELTYRIAKVCSHASNIYEQSP